MSYFFSDCKSIETRQDFFRYILEKERGGRISTDEYEKYLLSDECINDIDSIIEKKFNFTVPIRKTVFVNQKKRQFYSFSNRERMLLSFLCYRLHTFDEIFSKNLYSYIIGRQLKTIPIKIRTCPGIGKSYCYKADISSYAPSVDSDILIAFLQEVFEEEPELLAFMVSYINIDRYIEDGIEHSDAETVKLGTPLGNFFLNLYLNKVDKLIEQKAKLYIRYCDDIIIYADSLEEISKLRALFLDEIKKIKLNVNPKKEKIYASGEFVNFVGLSIAGNRQELPEATTELSKQLIRRNCKRILRLRKNNNLKAQNAMLLMIHFNNKIIDGLKQNFKNVTEVDKFKELEKYMLDSIRIVGLGRYCKSNSKYKITYNEMKKLGYKSLVNEYYQFKKHC